MLCVAGALYVLGWLIHTAYCAFTWELFTLFDYGLYTNSIRNCAEGHFFRCLLDDSYLRTHLSFSLALLAPYLKLVHHPMALWFAQWALVIGGALFVARAALRHGLRVDLAAALLLTAVAYHYAQAVMLSEFHGVSVYMILMPWLYACLCFKKRLTWLPLLLILGLREDAFLVAIPMLLYVAVKDRWKPGYLYAAVALLYGLIAIFGLFPLFTGASLMARRHREIVDNPLARMFGGAAGTYRLISLFWLFLPTLPFFFFRKRAWIPLLVFPLLTLAQAMGSNFKLQYMMQVHYPASVLACLLPAMVEAARGREASAWTRRWSTVCMLWLVGAVLFSHVKHGFVPGGGARERYGIYYKAPNMDGVMAFEAASHLPQTGTVMCAWTMAGFCANRKDLIVWSKYKKDRHSYDLVFMPIKALGEKHGEQFKSVITSPDFGLRYSNGKVVILERGLDPAGNAALQETYDALARTVPFSETALHNVRGVRNERWPDGRLVRYWEGVGHRTPVTLGYGVDIALEAGSYEAIFSLGSAAPRKHVKRSWGQLGLFELNAPQAFAEAEVDPIATEPGRLRRQVVPFSLKQRTQVEPRVTGADAQLWVDTVEFVRLPDETATTTVRASDE